MNWNDIEINKKEAKFDRGFTNEANEFGEV